MMTLENFFTTTEMNNGLVAPYRVREFMAVMQKETDCVVDNTGQWSAVASAIAATENKDCLDLFIELDGLRFISKWLKDAQKFSDDTIENSVEESITHLLRALGKMHLDYEKLFESEILTAVEDLLVHRSSKVKDNARVLFESWKTERESVLDVDKPSASVDDKAGESDDISKGEGCSESSPEKVVSASLDAVDKDERVEIANNSDKSLDPPMGDERPLNHDSLPSLPKSITEPPLCDSIEGLPEKLGSLEECNTSESRHLTSSSDAVDEAKTVTELYSLENSVIGGEQSSGKGLSVIDSKTFDSDVKGAIDASSGANQNISREGGDSNNCEMPKSSGGENRWGDSKGSLGTFFDGKVNTFGLLASNNDHAGVYGIVDPLEVARQVAMEVEREVVGYREQSCSSSEKPSQGDDTHENEGLPKEMANDHNSSEKSSDESSAMQEDSKSSSENLEMEQTNGTQDMATSQVTEAAQAEEGDANTEKGICSFDLNEEVHMEDSGNPFLPPVSTVSASRAAAAATVLPPGGPLKFEGNLGWKGSATTSAFRPLPESDKTNSRRSENQNLDFDLNVAEESSVEMNSKNLELDLNHTSGDGAPQGNCLSYSSSSSKQQQPISNIDLNDQPLFINLDSYDNNNSHLSKLDFFGGIKSDESAISIMGTRVEVNNRKDLLNGKTPFDANLGRTSNFLEMGPTLQYPNSSVYGYNNTIAPPLAIYGLGPPIPYNMVGSTSAVPTGFSQPPQYLMNMNGVGPSRSSFNLDSGMLSESGSKDPVGLGLFLNSAQARNVDEQLRPDCQLSVGTVTGGGKRKEPENGWENYPFRHYTPPWKNN